SDIRRTDEFRALDQFKRIERVIDVERLVVQVADTTTYDNEVFNPQRQPVRHTARRLDDLYIDTLRRHTTERGLLRHPPVHLRTRWLLLPLGLRPEVAQLVTPHEVALRPRRCN